MSINLDYEFIIPWSEFPDSFLEKWEREIFLTDTEDDGVVCDINFDFTPYCPGRYCGHPDNMYPSSGPDLDINSMQFTIPVHGACVGPLSDGFYAVTLQFARDWMEVNEDIIEERLLDWASSKHKDEVSEILAEVEAGVEEIRREREAASTTLRSGFLQQRSFVDMVCAQWEAERKNRGDN